MIPTIMNDLKLLCCGRAELRKQRPRRRRQPPPHRAGPKLWFRLSLAVTVDPGSQANRDVSKASRSMSGTPRLAAESGTPAAALEQLQLSVANLSVGNLGALRGS